MPAWFKRQRSLAPTPTTSKQTDVASLAKHADATRERGDVVEAVAGYEAILAVEPDNIYALYWLATLYQQGGDFAKAEQCCKRGLAIDPDQIGLLLRLGSVATASVDPMLALECYERAAQLDPDAPEINALLADQYCFLGKVREGVAAFDRAIARDPAVRLQSARLFVLNYANLLSAEELFDEHRQWAVRNEAPLRAQWQPHSGARDPDKRLRIGYVSPDLRDHAIAFFLEALLRAHDKSTHEIICFDTSPYPEDAVTARLKPHVDVWQRVGDLSDDALAEAIRTSRIDILMDLSGHTKHHRLLTFARKPAPVQVTWLGYLNTTGLAAMDYRITDNYLDPEGRTEQYHTETLYRLPNHSCFVPAPGSPSVGPLPALASGRITFGSINQWSKVTDEVKDVWAQVLRKLPDARLVVVARGAQNRTFLARIADDFIARGVSPKQLQVVPMLAFGEYLKLFQRIDVALDPFPYGGGTTTMQSLWMGVPVVTLAGRTAFARNSIGLLCEVELPQFVASTCEDYVEIALSVAGDVPALASLRAQLRARLQASALMDEKRFASNMESAYRAMWRRYCCS